MLLQSLLKPEDFTAFIGKTTQCFKSIINTNFLYLKCKMSPSFFAHKINKGVDVYNNWTVYSSVTVETSNISNNQDLEYHTNFLFCDHFEYF